MELLDRINFLAKKSRTEGLTEEEKIEQAKLRKEYVKFITGQIVNTLENTYILDEETGEKRPLPKKANDNPTTLN